MQAQIELVNMRALERFTEHRLLATMGQMLRTLEIGSPEDATTFAARDVCVERAAPEDAFREWRKSQ